MEGKHLQATIRTVLPSEIACLREFGPPEWNTDLSETFSFHFGQPYYYPLVAIADEKVVGCAQGIVNGSAGWLGNIVVRPEYRRRGIGCLLTRHLVELLRSRGCTHQILTATKLGEPVYRRLGFVTTSRYIFFRRDEAVACALNPRIRNMTPSDRSFVFDLDRSITAEERSPFLNHFLTEGWVHESAACGVDGFFLPGMALGPVIAANDEAGLALLRFRNSQARNTVVVPEDNHTAVELLRDSGYSETDRAPRMALGNDVDWQPALVFSRGSGYAG